METTFKGYVQQVGPEKWEASMDLGSARPGQQFVVGPRARTPMEAEFRLKRKLLDYFFVDPPPYEVLINKDPFSYPIVIRITGK